MSDIARYTFYFHSCSHSTQGLQNVSVYLMMMMMMMPEVFAMESLADECDRHVLNL